jgi:hypothetical protein
LKAEVTSPSLRSTTNLAHNFFSNAVITSKKELPIPDPSLTSFSIISVH